MDVISVYIIQLGSNLIWAHIIDPVACPGWHAAPSLRIHHTGYHSPTRGYLLLKTLQFGQEYAGWWSQVWRGSNFEHILFPVCCLYPRKMAGIAHQTNQLVFSVIFCNDICLTQGHHVINNHSIWVSGWSDVESWLWKVRSTQLN